MPHGFTDNKEISEFDAAINAALRPITQTVQALQNTINNYWKTIYPVGSIYISTSQTNPAQLFGGSWERYGVGRTLVSVDESQTEFNQVNKTGGAKSQSIRIDWQHKHDIFVPDAPGAISPMIYKNYVLNTASSRRNYVLGVDIPATSGDVEPGKLQDIPTSNVSNPFGTATAGSTTTNSQNVNTLQPYVTVYFWRRTQ